MRSTHAIFGILLLFLAMTALLPARAEVIDAVTGEPVAGAQLETIDPPLRLALEPLYGPLHAITGLPDFRILSWILWIALAIGAARLWKRRKQIRRAWWRELLLVTGYYLLYAAVALPLIWIGVIPKRWLPAVLFILPAIAYVVTLVLTLRRDRRWQAAASLTARCIGLLGFLAVPIPAFLLAAPGAVGTGRRLVPPHGTRTLDVHAHAQRSQDAMVGPRERLDFFRRHRIDFSAVTEHSCFDDPGPHETATYATMQATARAEGMEMLLLPGEEFTTHALHLVLLGVRRTYPAGPYRLPTPKEDPPHHGYDYRRLIAEVHREGGYVIVAHWWSHRQWRRVDWRLLVEYGVDGFEVTNGPELAPRELIEEWRKTGLPLFAASDFHGWQKSMYSWNLVEGGTAAERDPYEFLHRLFRERRVRPVVALYYDPRVPAFLEPPVGVWRYFTGLPPPNRIPWIVITVAAWAWLALRARRA